MSGEGPMSGSVMRVVREWDAATTCVDSGSPGGM